MKLIELFESEILLMGGNAFPSLKLSRINREDIGSTIDLISKTLSPIGITKKYIMNHLMGSVNKQADSGDIDIALDNSKFSKETLIKISDIIRQKYDNEYVQTKTLPGGQIQTAWPIANNPSKGLIQVDFILGSPDWLKFSHYSPGLDRSPYKGVWISTMLGVLAKMKKEYELWDEGPRNDLKKQIARVSWSYDLEKGLHRQWKLRKRPGERMGKTNPDEWETKLPAKPVRFSRVGYINTPEDVVRIILGDDVKPSDIETFEELWGVIKQRSAEGELPPVNEIKQRFAQALVRSSAVKQFKSPEDVLNEPIFRD
ncbi:MAG: hypothetical protein HC836_37630 [Richelia sp. RM2_1_2]|nr:hypothetical protein [Richelia sp. RM2_1_2]